MNKSVLGIGIAAVAGLLLGYLLFSDSSTLRPEADHSHATEITGSWTCSMHPQILLPDPGQCPICGMDLISAQTSGSGLLPGQFELTEAAVALADIQSIPVLRQVIGSDFQRLSGTLKANEKTIATQSAYYDGRIEQLFIFSEGEQVNQGQLIAKIYAPDLVSAQQELLSLSKMKGIQAQLYEAVRAKLKSWKLSDTQIADIEATGHIQEFFPIYASVSGNVTEITIAAGDYIKRGQIFFKVANLNTLWAEFDAYEAQFFSLKVGDSMSLEFQGQPGLELRGKITYISPMLNAAARTAKVRVVVSNSDNKLKPGMFVQGWVSGDSVGGKEELVIPESAVLWTGTRSVVYVRSSASQPTFEMREITLGYLTGDQYQVISGLEEGELVVTRGTFTLDAAAQLSGNRSMMSAAAFSESVSELSVFINEIVQQYLPIKDALVASDALGVNKAARSGLEALKTFPKLVNEAELLSAFSNLAATPELDEQREHFRILSELLIAVGSSGKTVEQTLYVQYCPMANSNRGATWVSQYNDIQNPYFGNAMLTCGETRSIWVAN